MNLDSSILMAIAGSALFGASSVTFRNYSRKISPLWMNSAKAHISWIFLGFIILGLSLFSGHLSLMTIPIDAIFFLLLSGLIGLCIADIFLMTAFAELGSARTLMLFTFQPLLLGFGALWLFQQKLSPYHFLAAGAMGLCLYLFSLESFKKSGHWNLKGLGAGLLGLLLDATGVFATRNAFEISSRLEQLDANFFRTTGALIGFFFIARLKPYGLLSHFKNLNSREKASVTLASIFGTSISLLLWIAALSKGHMATIGTLAATGPLVATVVESIQDKQWPSKYFFFALIIFGIGFYFLQKGLGALQHP